MAKNKLLTIPIEEEKRERLNQYCGERGKTVSQMITGFIDRLLDGSIDPSTSIEPVELSRKSIDIEEIVEKVIDKLSKDTLTDLNSVEPRMVNLSERILDQRKDFRIHTQWAVDESVALHQRLESLELQIRGISINSVEPSIEDTEITHIPKSIATATTKKPIEQSIDQHLQPYNLEDTKTYLRDKCDYNRTRERRGDRISQGDISIHLLTYNYPHPSNKKWSRDEVRAVCKLWEFRM